jgi:hypothetical protein
VGRKKGSKERREVGRKDGRKASKEEERRKKKKPKFGLVLGIGTSRREERKRKGCRR